MLIASSLIGFLSYANAEEDFNDCVMYERQAIDWTMNNTKWNCIDYNHKGVSVMQMNLDQNDIDTLNGLRNGTIVQGTVEQITNSTQNEPQPIPFADIRHPDEEAKKKQEKLALKFICEWYVYLHNYKIQQGCILNKDGTYSAP